jgi:SAM-dependent methyltransferase
MSTVVEFKDRQKVQWSAAAAGWDRWFEWYARAFGPLMTWCCDAAALAPGDRLLDVACGSGLPALLAGERVTPSGRVVAIDLAPGMLQVARGRAAHAGLAHVEFLEMDAERLAFDDASFDAVTCACGLMFFPDLEGALREIRRVLKPGGRLAVGVWDDPGKSPFLTIGGRAVADYFPPAAPPNPNAPGPFRFAPPGVLEETLSAAGFSAVHVESLSMAIECASADEYWQVFTEMAAGIKEKIAALPDADRERLAADVKRAAAAYAADGRLRLVATPLCGRGVKPL